MKPIYFLFNFVLLTASPIAVTAACPPALDFKQRVLAGDDVIHLCEAYRGKVVLVVNTASRCAFTPQYEGLEALYGTYKERGLVVLGFPSNDFGGQEPGNEGQVKEFCRLTYGVRFPMFEMVHAKKGRAGPLYQKLAELSGDYPKWNFHKYLIARDGQVVDSFSSFTDPQSPRVVKKIEALLDDKG